MDKNKILLVEDDERLGELQADYLKSQGYEVSWLKDGHSVYAEMKMFVPDVIVLDLILPGKSGLDVCREIRESFQGIILFLTASEDDIDHVACLEIGGDDFVSKPLNPRVLVARIRTLLRNRANRIVHALELTYGKLQLKRNARETIFDGATIKLTSSEFDLLWILASHPGEVMDRNKLFQELRSIEFDGIDRSIDTKIVALRKKLNDAGEQPRRIITVRNKGYLFAPETWE